MRCMTAPKKKKADKVEAGRSDKRSIQFFTNDRLADAFEAYLASKEDDDPPSKKKAMETALKEYLAKRGFWPPPPDTST